MIAAAIALLVAVEAPAPLPPRLAVGTGSTFQPGALIQGWYAGSVPPGEDRAFGSTFRVRRAELYVRGELPEAHVAWTVMIDPAKLLEFQERAVPVDTPAGPGTVTVK